MRPSNNDFTQWHGAVIGLEPDTSYHGYDYTAIRPLLVDDVLVQGRQGHISVRNAQGRHVAVFDVMGRLVTNTTLHDTEWNLAVRPGFYVVKVGYTSAPAKKVVVF